MASRFRMNPSFPAEAARTPEAEAVVKERAQSVAKRAKEIRAEHDPDEVIEVEVVEDHRGKVARVVNRDWKGHFSEFGTVHEPARPYLRPALDAERLPPAPADEGPA